jgi:hypothetical protein
VGPAPKRKFTKASESRTVKRGDAINGIVRLGTTLAEAGERKILLCNIFGKYLLLPTKSIANISARRKTIGLTLPESYDKSARTRDSASGCLKHNSASLKTRP